jgi:outer membrane protein OmpA-like peptidoglycan-associated protein
MKPSKLFVAAAVAASAVTATAPARAQGNLAAASAGGNLVFISSQYNDSDWAAANLIDGSSTQSWSGRSAGPQAVILAFRDGGLVEIDDVVVNPYSREGNENWARTAEVHVSTTYPFRDFRKVGTLTLAPEGSDQVLSFERGVRARYLKVIFLDNGGGGYMQAGEIRAIGRPVADGGPPPPTHAYHESATIERFSSQYNETDWAVANLVAPDAAPGQWAGRNAEPQEVVIALAETSPVTDVAVSNYAREAPDNWARTIEVHLSPSSPYRDFHHAGTLEVPPVGDLHTLRLPEPTPTRYVKLLFRRNGGGGYMEAARVRIYGVPAAAAAERGGGEIGRQLRETGRAVTREIHFATGSAEILPASEPVLEEIAALLRDDAELELIIEGHTDDVGGAEMNLDLSRRRADAVKRWLVDRRGIVEVRLTTAGYGLTRPVADNDSDEGRARNRRVELARRD